MKTIIKITEKLAEVVLTIVIILGLTQLIELGLPDEYDTYAIIVAALTVFIFIIIEVHHTSDDE